MQTVTQGLDFMATSKEVLMANNNHKLLSFAVSEDNATLVQVKEDPTNPRKAVAIMQIDRNVAFVEGMGLKPHNPEFLTVRMKLTRIVGEEVAKELGVLGRLELVMGVIPQKVADVIPTLQATYGLGITLTDVIDADVTGNRFGIRFSSSSAAYCGVLPVSIIQGAPIPEDQG